MKKEEKEKDEASQKTIVRAKMFTGSGKSENNTMRVDIEEILLPDMLSEKRFELLKELFEDLNPFQGTEEEVLKTCFTEAALQEGIIASSLLATYIFVGSSHFVHQSPVAIDIANAINTTVENVLILSESPEWKKAVRYWGWRGDPTPKKMQEKGRVPFALQEVYLLTCAFQKDSDVRLITYDGFIDARVKDVLQYDFVLEDGRMVKKHDVILAFPKDRMPYVKAGIKRRKSVAELGLKRVDRPSDKPKLDLTARLGSLVECVMRNGLVVVGENVWISRYNMVLRVGGKKGNNGKIIIVYKHALHDFRVLKQSKKRDGDYSEDWDDEEK